MAAAAHPTNEHWTISGNLTPATALSQFKGKAVNTLAANYKAVFTNIVGAPSYYILSGTLQGSIYRYPLSLTVDPGYTAIVAEIGHDQSSHQQLLEVALVSAPPPSPTGGTAATSLANTSPVATPSSSGADPSTSGYFETVWADPLNITTNLVKDNVSWDYNGTDVTSATYSDYRWWLSNDGWYEVSHRITSGYTGSPELPIKTYDEFENNAFCAILGVYVQTYYEPNEAIANGNGTITGTTDTYDYYSGGGCPGLHYYNVISGGA